LWLGIPWNILNLKPRGTLGELKRGEASLTYQFPLSLKGEGNTGGEGETAKRRFLCEPLLVYLTKLA
jgi:hypothetical protein